MSRNQNIARLNRYRYEIAAAIFLTVAALGLLAAATAGRHVPVTDKVDASPAHFPTRTK